ncbi:MAG TPA: DUF3467 domain-containing protein [Pyrinomonadaceae bacterium]|jgi:flagellar protein FlaG|nr:DUF3467 domain-containing protein [Pyrinomonadaceae bacterium]
MKTKSRRQVEAPASQAPQQLTVATVKAADYRESYANSVQVQISVWDFRLNFSRTEQTPEQLIIKEFQAIDLSPQQAKAVCNLLAQNLAQYERTFGPINLQAVSAQPQLDPAPGARPQ